MEDVEQLVNDYVEFTRENLKLDEEMWTELFSTDFSDEEFFWETFKQQALINIAERGEPQLSIEEFQEVHRKMFLKSIIDTVEKLKDKGLVAGDTISGFKLTELGKSVVENKQ